MKTAPRTLMLAMGSILAIGPGPAVAEEEEKIYACPDGKGDVVFQTEPCRTVPEKKAPPSPPAASPKKAPAPTRRASPVPMPTKAAAPSPERRMQTPWRMVRPAQSAPPAPRRRTGKQTFPISLAGSDQPTAPSFATPQDTWRTFLAALETGDRNGAVSCLTPHALERLGADAESIPMDQLRKMVSGFTRIEDEGDLGPYWSIYGVGGSWRPKWILFEETDAGEWKIAGI